ncbi:hypothetical protein [Maribacter sp. 2307ULW6-5]|uniref:hypothetical protein n=1 Tax=Maribacter sp. 2307ULW6-5 TaxID=3386275 RepID=UPI0039BD0DF1
MSETTLNNLITTLKTEAIEAAEKEAAAIVQGAQEEAKALVAKARTEREELLAQAKKEAHDTLNKGQTALEQAARDVNVALKNDILGMLKKVLEQDIADAFSPELLKKAVVQAVENVGSDAQLTLSEDLGEQLAPQLLQELKKTNKSAEITAHTKVLKRLDIGKKGAGWSYTVTPGTVADVLAEHLSPKWAALLNQK